MEIILSAAIIGILIAFFLYRRSLPKIRSRQDLTAPGNAALEARARAHARQQAATASNPIQAHPKAAEPLPPPPPVPSPTPSPSPRPFKPAPPIRPQASGPNEAILLEVTSTSCVTSPAPVTDQLEKDAWDQASLDLYGSGLRRSLKGHKLRLSFTDQLGQKTVRDVETIAFARDPAQSSGMLWAFCHLRQGNRPFRFSGVQKVVDLDTGEISEDLGAHLQRLYELTPDYRVDAFLEVYGDACFALFCIAKADGAFRAKERDVLRDFAIAYGLTGQSDCDHLIAAATDWVPSKSKDYWDAVKAISSTNDMEFEKTVFEYMLKIVTTDKRQHDDERKMLRYAAKTWSLPAPE